MNKVGYRYYIEGEFCKRLEHLDDPADENWEIFETANLHPAGKNEIVVWSQFLDEKGKEECDEIAMIIFNWMRGEKRWEGLFANVWRKGKPDQRVGGFQLC